MMEMKDQSEKEVSEEGVASKDIKESWVTWESWLWVRLVL